MSILRYERTSIIVRNIKELQNINNYTDEQVAEYTGINLTTYKNIVRSIGPGGNKFIKDIYIKKIADLYHCSTDYILGLSNDKTLDRYGDPAKISLEILDNKPKQKFIKAKVIIENRNNGVQPAMFIIEDGRVHMVTITPDHQFYITDEGPVGERYDEHGKWCGKNNMVRSEEEIRECISNLEKKLKENENLFAATEDIFLKQRLLTNSFNIESQLYAFYYVLGERYEYKHL